MKYENHIAEKEEIRKIKEELKEKCKKSKTVAIASFDLQQVIHLPISNENAVFNKRSLANYNLTMYDSSSKKCHCFSWHEAQSRRGSNEVSTAICEGLKNYDEEGIKEVHLFADSCSGRKQQKH